MRRPPSLRALSVAAALASLTGGCGAPTGELEQANGTWCPGPNTLRGVDVSEYQGDVDWNAVKASGITFAIARVGDGYYVDPTFQRNWDGIRAAGLVRGVYQFFHPGKDPVAQANILLAHIGQLQPGDLAPAIDVEVNDGVSPATYNAQIHAWVDRVQSATGLQPLIYSGSYYWDGNVGSGDFASYPLWLPAYGPVCPRLPAPWGSWRIHQYSSTGSVPGIGGNVDMDLFDGTYGELLGLGVRMTCGAHCEGSVVVGTDCGRSDCAPAGGTCIEAGGPHCVGLPRGSLDGATCAVLNGWTQDLSNPAAPSTVELWLDGPRGQGAGPIVLPAGQHRDDLCGPLGSCDHAFSVDTPLALRDGRAHQVFAYGGSFVDGNLAQPLGGSPKSIRCAAPLAGDFNGDGRADLIQWRGDLASIPVCLSLGDGWSCKGLDATYVGGLGAGNGGSAVWDGGRPLLGRFDGDRFVDLFEFADGWSSIPVCASLGTGWSCENAPAVLAGPSGASATGNAGSGVWKGATPLVGDVDGDGRDDVIEYDPASAALPVCHALGSGWSCDAPAATFVGGDYGAGSGGGGLYPGGTPLVGDFDGDGRKDLLQFNAGWGSIPVCLSVGGGWSCKNLAAVYVGGTGAGNAGSGVYAGATPLVGDFDGDGKSDVIEWAPARGAIAVCRSLGTGWSCRSLAASFDGGDGPAGVDGSGVYPGSVPVVGDVDGDGRADLVQYDDHASTIPLCRSLGTGWSCKNLAAVLAPSSGSGSGGGAGNGGAAVYVGGQPLLADVDGDGHQDLVQYQSDGWGSIPVCKLAGSSWSCVNAAATYVGGTGAGNGGSGVY